MKKLIFSAATLATLQLFTSARTAQALDISITPDGSIEVYTDSVLGTDSENEYKPKRYPSRVIAPANKQEIRIKTDAEKLKVETINRANKQEYILDAQDTDRIRLKMPARQTEEQQRLEMAKQRANKTDTSVSELERQVRTQVEQRELELSKLSPEEREKRKLFYEEQKEKRQDRAQEQLEIKNNIGPNGQELNLESRGIKAALRNKAVTLDPETNSLILTTQDGEQRVLTTLPDQAVERMLEIKGLTEIDAENVEIEDEDGRLKYVTKARRVKRLFGMFERPIETEVSVDDQSGEVTETMTEKPTIISRFLDRLSF